MPQTSNSSNQVQATGPRAEYSRSSSATALCAFGPGGTCRWCHSSRNHERLDASVWQPLHQCKNQALPDRFCRDLQLFCNSCKMAWPGARMQHPWQLGTLAKHCSLNPKPCILSPKIPNPKSLSAPSPSALPTRGRPAASRGGGLVGGGWGYFPKFLDHDMSRTSTNRPGSPPCGWELFRTLGTMLQCLANVGFKVRRTARVLRLM